MKELAISRNMSGIKAGTYLKSNFCAYILISSSHFVEHVFRRTNLRGFHYFAYSGCYDYHIMKVLNNYHKFPLRCAQTF